MRATLSMLSIGMHINCRYCASEIPTANINLDKLRASCPYCDAVFSIAGELGLTESEKQKGVEQLSGPLPSRFTIDKSPKELKITRKWYSPKEMIAPVLFTMALDIFVCIWYGIAISVRQSEMMFCGSVHLIAALGFNSWVLSMFFRKTTITVNSRHISIEHTPTGAKNNKTLSTSTIAQIYCKENIKHGKYSTTINCQVEAIMRDQRRELLLTDLYIPEQALYIEQEIERFLGIQNQDVQGEMRRY